MYSRITKKKNLSVSPDIRLRINRKMAENNIQNGTIYVLKRKISQENQFRFSKSRYVDKSVR